MENDVESSFKIRDSWTQITSDLGNGTAQITGKYGFVTRVTGAITT